MLCYLLSQLLLHHPVLKLMGKISGGDPDEIKLPPETSSITPPPITPPAIAITMAKAPIMPPTIIFGFNKILEL